MTDSSRPIGEQLWASLPRMYREPPPSVSTGVDGQHIEYGEQSDHLRLFLDACGQVLDGLKANLDQRLVDTVPDGVGGEGAQAWLLPYFAELFDTYPLAPTVEGRRQEVQNAIQWRQAKGTPHVVEAIAQVVGQAPVIAGDAESDSLEVELREGWKQVLRTVRIDDPVLPYSAYGAVEPDRLSHSASARHPGLPMGTVDFRRAGRAVRTENSTPHIDARHSSFPAPGPAQSQRIRTVYHPIHTSGVPAFPGSYEDSARRTIDLRSAGPHGVGAAHPRRIRLFAPPVVGFFRTAQWKPSAPEVELRLVDVAEPPRAESSEALLAEEDASLTDAPEQGSDTAESLTAVGEYVPLGEGAIELDGLRLERPLVIPAGVGPVTIRRSAIRELRIETAEPVYCEDCLFERLTVKRERATDKSSVTLMHCTVLGDTDIDRGRLEASECIFGSAGRGTLRIGAEAKTWIRYTRLPSGLPEPEASRWFAVTRDAPLYFSDEYGTPGCGLLDLGASAALLHGGEDGGELGVSHLFAHIRRVRAVLDRVSEHMPVGISVAFEFDPRLDCMPPKLIRKDSES